MTTDQKYVGRGSNARTLEATANTRLLNYPTGPLTPEELAAFKAKSYDGLPKTTLSVSLSVSTHSLTGPSYAETLIFALQAYLEQMQTETGAEMRGGIDSVNDAHFAFRHGQNASQLLLDLSLALAKCAQNNYWAGKTTEQEYVRHFLRQNEQGETEKSEFAKTWMGVTYPQE